jgi:hypothetical protein
MQDVRQYKVIHDGGGLRVLVVLRPGVNTEGIVELVRDGVAAALVSAGAVASVIHVDLVDALARDRGHGAKFKLIESQP